MRFTTANKREILDTRTGV